MTARVVGQKLGERLGQTVIIDNRPGAASNIGMQYVARAPADGYTFLFAVPTVAQNPFLYKLSFDPTKDLVPVSQLTEVSFVLLKNPTLPANSVADLLKLSTSRPGGLTCGSAGATPGMGCALIKVLGKIEVTTVPYKGNAPAITDLVGGQLDFLFDVVNSAQAQVQGGRVKALATTDRKRGNPTFPDLPTVSETLPGLVLTAWQAVMAPAGTPAPVLQKMDQEIAAVMADPAVVQKLRTSGIEPSYANSATFGKTVKSETVRYEKLIREANIKVD
jgi:tripartite-type tricarboxylate transporter receptor subunit TctC